MEGEGELGCERKIVQLHGTFLATAVCSRSHLGHHRNTGTRDISFQPCISSSNTHVFCHLSSYSSYSQYERGRTPLYPSPKRTRGCSKSAL